MSTIQHRMLELRSTMTDAQARKITTALMFREVSEPLSGEDLASILAALTIDGAAQAKRAGIELDSESTPEGTVHTATIQDSVKMADGIGG